MSERVSLSGEDLDRIEAGVLGPEGMAYGDDTLQLVAEVRRMASRVTELEAAAEMHCRRIVRRAHESYQEFGDDEEDEFARLEPPRIDDLLLWGDVGIDYMQVRAEVDAETPCGGCGRLADGDAGAHLMGCESAPC